MAQSAIASAVRERPSIRVGGGDPTTIDHGLPQPQPQGRDEHDPRIKKIYVYADDVWTSHSTNDRRIVRVQTPAFDLSGWIDFSRAREQDQFQVELRVNLAHASDVHFNTAGFQGGALVSFSQVMPGAGAPNYISGNFIDVIIRQTWSLDNFATPVPVAYQFIVESQ
jgi:hypothetical protein